MTYVELQAATHFSFLRGVSSAEELFTAAWMLWKPHLLNSCLLMLRRDDAWAAVRLRCTVGRS